MIYWQLPAMVMLAGYLLGSIPFGVILTRIGGAGDLRSIGSGNIGATNVLRTGRKGLAAATLILDGAKGAVAVLMGRSMLPDGGDTLCGVMALIGHCYPVWLQLRGGKGVATMLGVTLALQPVIGSIFAGVWIGLFLCFRISSVAGVSAAIAAPVAAAVSGEIRLLPALAAMTLLLLWRHRANFGRLLRGEETRFGQPSERS